VGDLVVIKLPYDALGHGAAIGSAILRTHPHVAGVFHDAGVHGEHRLRRLRPLAGVTRTRTVHAEFGARFHVDLARAYFSPRLANEHQRIAELVRPGEAFLDATAGVGPFAILVARRKVTGSILAVDVNPDAVELLLENARLNKVDDRIQVRRADAAELGDDVGPFDRIVVNLPHGPEPLLDAAVSRLAPGGHLHVTRILPEDEAPTWADHVVRTHPTLVLEGRRVVHPYSPRDRLFAFDFGHAQRGLF
jgi:tRNA (guanine37-N1)-methyltransferase